MKYFIGVEVGVKNIACGLVDKNGKLIRRNAVPTDPDKNFDKIIEDVCMLIKAVTSDEGIELKNIKAIGVGCPGVTDNMHGVVIKNYTLNFNNAPVRAAIQKSINLPVYVENDANCVAIAEYLVGASYGTTRSVTVRIGVGIGGGIIIDGCIYNGYNYGGTEFGHMVIDHKGRQCTCGRKGCWEQYSSASAIISQTKNLIKEYPDSLLAKMVDNNDTIINELTVFDAAKAGDEHARQLCDEFIEYLGEGLANIVNIIMPEVIVIAGPITKLGVALTTKLNDLLSKTIYCKEIMSPELKIAETGTAGIIVGAAMLSEFKDSKLDLLI